MEYRGYTARVTFDEEAGVLFGEVEGLRDVVTFEATNVDDLAVAFRDSVDDYLAMCAERGEAPEKPYSGKFLVRIDPRLHRDIAMAAARSGKSLNAFAGDLLKGWIQREYREIARRPPAAPTTRTRGLSEELSEYPSSHPAAIIADVQGASVWQEWTRDTPGSITPARKPDTPPASNTPQPRTPSSRSSKKKAA